MTKHALAEDQTPPARKHHVAADKPRPVRHVAEHRRRDRTEIRAAGLRRRHHRAVAQCDEDSVRASGGREVGRASWYGGRHLGRRTASGERLDSIHNTAAHRSLPLNSLVRVTNLDNGRSVIARVTDRGPVSHNFLIDLSPSAADELRMKEAGVVPVSVEPVFQAADAAP
ncbi:MAG TPA: septal ring lytic transglycosylase RlpA family protein [Stellaceae bacterium]